MGPSRPRKGYKPAALIQAMLEYVTSPDTLMTFFFSYIYDLLCSKEEHEVEFDMAHALSYLDGLATCDSEDKDKLNEALEKFAEYIVENFLLPRTLLVAFVELNKHILIHYPVRASSVKTPQPTPTSLSSLQSSTPIGTRQRVSVLRKSCLVRDRHRCVVTRKFDRADARKRFA